MDDLRRGDHTAATRVLPESGLSAKLSATGGCDELFARNNSSSARFRAFQPDAGDVEG
jgi:hypothetical protein